MHYPVAVIVINYRMEGLTVKMVLEELSKIVVPHKTIVVNNGATEASDIALTKGLNAQLILNLDEQQADVSKDTFVISSKENLGFARGNNLGAKFCKRVFDSEYLLFTNNDIKFSDSDVVERLLDKMQATPGIGVIGPRVVGLDGKEQSPHPYLSFWDRMVWMYWSTFFYSKEKKIRRFHLDYTQKAKEGFHYYVMGSFFIVNADDFYQCGMMDSKTFMYAEELILSERMKAIGKGIYYYPQVTVIHAHGATTAKHAHGKSQDWQFESLMYYYKAYLHVCWPILQLGRITHYLMKLTKKNKWREQTSVSLPK